MLGANNMSDPKKLKAGILSRSTRRDFLRSSGLAVGTFILGGPKIFARPPVNRPNIIFIMSDDHAAPAISAYNEELTSTPNIDRIANEGIRFDNCFCTNSICTPSRAVILTGKYSHLNGVKTLADVFDGSQATLPKLLQKAGYHTSIVGKWHLKSEPTGFDDYIVLPGQGRYYDPLFRKKGNWPKTIQHKGYCTDIITDLTLRYLDARPKNKPFFLMCQHKAPHDPFTPKKEYKNLFADHIPEPPNLFDDYKDRKALQMTTQKVGMKHLGYGDPNWSKYQRYMYTKEERAEFARKTEGLAGKELKKEQYQIYMRRYLQCVRSIDEGVGKILDYLDAENLTQNTIVIYTSDQGFFLGEHGLFDKRFFYEESLRMPLLMRHPDTIKPGSASDAIVSNVDFAQTLLDHAGVEAPADMQGESFRQIAQGRTEENWRKEFYYRYWMHMASFDIPAHLGIRTARYKLIYYYGKTLGVKGAVGKDTTAFWELFDLKRDRREMKNLYHDPAYSKVIDKLKSRLLKLRKDLKDDDDDLIGI